MKYLIASIFSVTVMIETTNTQTKQIQQAQQIEQTQIDSSKKYQGTQQLNIEETATQAVDNQYLVIPVQSTMGV